MTADEASSGLGIEALAPVPSLEALITDESLRQKWFPVTRNWVFMGHAGVSPLPMPVQQGMNAFLETSVEPQQEHTRVWHRVRETRRLAAEWLGAGADEMALIGPTSLGLNLVALGLPWEKGDEVVYYADDYPANVYPWAHLEAQGVRPVPIRPEVAGHITWETVEPYLSSRTKLVALASTHFLSGRRIDIDAMGRALHERGILFCLDAIQSLGAFPVSVEHVDFLSADAHKWMLGPCGAGIFYVARQHFDRLQPALLGSWNVHSPDFIAQSSLEWESGARRYEPGTLNMPGILGMASALEFLACFGLETITQRLLSLRQGLSEGLQSKGYTLLSGSDEASGTLDSAIVTARHPEKDMPTIHYGLQQAGIVASLRKDRAGTHYLRFSPHFYNTMAEIDQVMALL